MRTLGRLALLEKCNSWAGTGNIKLIFDEFQRGGGAAAGGSSGSRDEAMRLALQKKRWIEMQLHEVEL